MELRIGDRVELRKQHPCGSKTWQIFRVGMDIKCEKAIKKILTE